MLKKNSLSFFACILIILLPALYNGFPLLTSDSGSYIGNAFTLFIPSDRTITYSVFIRIASLAFSLWGVVIIQAILLVLFLFILVRHFCTDLDYRFLFPAIILVITVCTSAAWFCAQLMPDIFTAILLLAICVLFFVPLKKKSHTPLLLIFIWGCIIMHNSHLVISLLVAVCAALIFRCRKNLFLYQRSLMLLAISIIGFLTLSTMNLISGKGFRPSASTHVFLICRMVENGIMDKFLQDNCATNEYKLCAYKDQLPDRQWDFMWNPNSPLYKTGGWDSNKEEYSRIIRHTLTTPKYLGLHIYKSTEATFRQLSQITIGDSNGPLAEPSNPNFLYRQIEKYYNHEMREYRSSLQNLGIIKFDLFNALIFLFAFLSTGSVLFVSAIPNRFKKPFETEWQNLFTVVLLYLLFNAFTTATFSTVTARFQSRVFWVLPFFCMLYLINFFRKKQAS